MSLFNFLFAGGGANIVKLSNYSTISDNSSPLAKSLVRFNSDGSIDEWTRSAGAYSQISAGEWIVSEPISNIGDSYEIKLNSWTGFTPNPNNTATWYDLGTSPEWYYETSSSGTRPCNPNFSIRKKGTTEVLATATINMETVLP